MSYIHENPDWPNLRWDDAKLLPLLADVRHRQGRLLGRMEGLGFRLRAEASLTTLTADVIKSSAIEGAVLDAEQVRSSIARRLGLDFGGKVQTSRDVEGVVEMMLDATQKYAQPLTAERLFNWHASLFPTGRSGMRRITVGAWRPADIGPMQVVSGPIGRERIHFEAPPADRLKRDISLFLKWFGAANGVDPVLKAGVAHFWFVTIHPFEDGNGRISRAIADMALARAEGTIERFYSMSTQIEAEKKHYYLNLEQSQKGGVYITSWLEWFLGCLGRAVAGAEDGLASVLRKAKTWEQINSQSPNVRAIRHCGILTFCSTKASLSKSRVEAEIRVTVWLSRKISQFRLPKIRSDQFHTTILTTLCRERRNAAAGNPAIYPAKLAGSGIVSADISRGAGKHFSL